MTLTMRIDILRIVFLLLFLFLPLCDAARLAKANTPVISFGSNLPGSDDAVFLPFCAQHCHNVRQGYLYRQVCDSDEIFECCSLKSMSTCCRKGETLTMTRTSSSVTIECSCPATMVYDRTENAATAGTAQCTSCPDYMTFENDSCRCKGGRKPDEATPFDCTCPGNTYAMPDGSCGVCSDNEQYDPVTHSCICFAGSRDEATGECVLCPEGEIRTTGGGCITTHTRTVDGALSCDGALCKGALQAANSFLNQKGNQEPYQKEFIPTLVGECVAQDDAMTSVAVLAYDSNGHKAQLMCRVKQIWMTTEVSSQNMIPIASYCHRYHFDDTLGDDITTSKEFCYGRGRRLFFLELQTFSKAPSSFPYYEATHSTTFVDPHQPCFCDPNAYGEFCDSLCSSQCTGFSDVGPLCRQNSTAEHQLCCGRTAVSGALFGVLPDGRKFGLDCAFDFGREQCPAQFPGGSVTPSPTPTTTSTTATTKTTTVTPSTSTTISSTTATTTAHSTSTHTTSSTPTTPTTTNTNTNTNTNTTTTTTTTTPVINGSISGAKDQKNTTFVIAGIVSFCLAVFGVFVLCVFRRKKSQPIGFEEIPLTRLQ